MKHYCSMLEIKAKQIVGQSAELERVLKQLNIFEAKRVEQLKQSYLHSSDYGSICELCNRLDLFTRNTGTQNSANP